MSKWVKTVAVSVILYFTNELAWDSTEHDKSANETSVESPSKSATDKSDCQPVWTQMVLASAFYPRDDHHPEKDVGSQHCVYYMECWAHASRNQQGKEGSNPLDDGSTPPSTQDEWTQQQESDQESRSCCQAIRRASFHFLPDSLSMELSQVCNASLAEVPAVSASDSSALQSGQSKQDSALQPRYALQFARHVPTVTSFVVPPPPPSTANGQWYHFVWDETASKGQWLTNPDDATMESSGSPSQDKPLHKEDHGLFSYWPFKHSHEPHILSQASHAHKSTLDAHLDSKLSSYGGMHRTMQHTLNMSWQADSDENQSIYEFSVDVMMHISSDAYINLEDAIGADVHLTSKGQNLLDNHNNRVKIDLVTPPGSTINIEEPAFASPQHTVLMRITGQVESVTNIVLSYKSHLDLRYPLPIGRSSGNYRQIHILPPTLVHAQVNGSAVQEWRRSSPWPQEPTLSTFVSCGRILDLWYVLGTSVLVSLVGASIMLLDVMRIKHWYYPS
jgi:hypothetical protein